MRHHARPGRLSAVAACAALLAGPASAEAVTAFEYDILLSLGADGGSQDVRYEAADPERCGSTLGWVDTRSFQSETKARDLVAERQSGTSRIRVRAGAAVEDVSPGLKRIGGERNPFGFYRPATVEGSLTGCVTPEGNAVIALSLDIEVRHGPNVHRFTLTHDGPPARIGERLSTLADLDHLRAKANDGRAASAHGEVSWFPRAMSGPGHDLVLRLTLQNQGATQ